MKMMMLTKIYIFVSVLLNQQKSSIMYVLAPKLAPLAKIIAE